MATKLLLTIFVAFLASATVSGEPPARFLQSTKPNYSGVTKEKQSHIRFFMHETGTGPNTTAVPVAEGPNTSSSPALFGLVSVIDDPLTAGPELSSRLVGRAQGLYAFAAQDTLTPFLTMNFVFVEGEHKGSTLAVFGSSKMSSRVRELPIIGGSGLFRLARGYVLSRTQNFDVMNGNGVIEYNCYVLHH